MREVCIDGETLTIEDVVRVARENAKVGIPEEVKKRVRRSRQVLEKLVRENRVIYGVNTGFGVLSSVRISREEIGQLQSDLIRSHSSGVGEPLSTETVRALMLLCVNTLAKGYFGIRLEPLETIVEMLNKRGHPVIPGKGSVGASGDLAPLSHMILVVMGEGKAECQGKVMSGREAMEKAGIKPVRLEFKEGIALNNGTQLMTAIAALTVYDAENLIKTAEVATALTLEALLGVSDAFDERIHMVRSHEGQAITARNIRELVVGSRLVQTGKEAMEKRARENYQCSVEYRSMHQGLSYEEYRGSHKSRNLVICLQPDRVGKLSLLFFRLLLISKLLHILLFKPSGYLLDTSQKPVFWVANFPRL